MADSDEIRRAGLTAGQVTRAEPEQRAFWIGPLRFLLPTEFGDCPEVGQGLMVDWTVEEGTRLVVSVRPLP
jgi:hypothetical protein